MLPLSTTTFDHVFFLPAGKITSPICNKHKSGTPDFLRMPWILLALLGAVTNAGYFIIIKRYVATVDPKILTGIGFTCGGPVIYRLRNKGVSGSWPGFFLSGCRYRNPEYYQPVPDLFSPLLFGSLAFHSHALVHSDNSDWHLLPPLKRGSPRGPGLPVSASS